MLAVKITTLAVTFATTALAQSVVSTRPDAMPSRVRHAGTYHVATATWTRASVHADDFGPDVIYSNTAPSGYFSSVGGAGGFAPGAENFDEGGLPGTTNGHVFTGTPNRNAYLINCVQIGYCDLGGPATSGWSLNFFSHYTPCTYDPFPDANVTVTGLPANGGCWIMDLDLTGGSEFCLTADGNGVWDPTGANNSFGWSYTYAGSAGGAGQSAGFLLAGNPAATEPSYGIPGANPDGSNTYYGTTLCPGLGTGYLTQDFWFLQPPGGTNSSCWFFGGYQNGGPCAGPITPFASWHLELSADTNECVPTFGTAYCTTNPNSTGVESRLELIGSGSPLADNVTLRAFDLPQFAFGYFITSQTQGVVMNPGGSQGNRCVVGSVGSFFAPGQVKNSGSACEITLATNIGEWSLAAIPTQVAPYSAAAGITTNFQLWHRDFVGGATSNFTTAVSHTW